MNEIWEEDEDPMDFVLIPGSLFINLFKLGGFLIYMESRRTGSREAEWAADLKKWPRTHLECALPIVREQRMKWHFDGCGEVAIEVKWQMAIWPLGYFGFMVEDFLHESSLVSHQRR